jgi:hypothetical protein
MKKIIFAVIAVIALSAQSAEFYGSYIDPGKIGDKTKRCAYVEYSKSNNGYQSNFAKPEIQTSYISGVWISKDDYCVAEFKKK